MENTLQMPRHVAIIPDGNRRWAKKQGFPEIEGHRVGAESIKNILRKAHEVGIHTMTLWGFSTENWKRSEKEVEFLIGFFGKLLDENLEEALKNDTRIIHLGRKDRLPEKLLKKISNAELLTIDNKSHVLNIAIDYGGQDEIMRATKKVCTDVTEGKITIDQIFETDGKCDEKNSYFKFKNYLDTKDQPYPYPDLVIRTSGEKRLSGFLSWQIAYSELYFTDLYMPEFGPDEFMEAVNDFAKRNRRFGGN